MKYRRVATIIGISAFIALLLCLLPGCDPTEHPFQKELQKKEILIYCGTTMRKPIRELATLMEKRSHCLVKISYGASGYLQKSIEINRRGDLFLPGNISYLTRLRKKGIVTTSVDVGCMEMELFVRRGNPKAVKADLHQLLRRDVKTAVGAAAAGSVGRETRFLLQRWGIYREVLDNAASFGADSRDLVWKLRHGEADVVLNWRAVLYQQDNIRFIEAIPLPHDQTRKSTIAMGLLRYSSHPFLARQFLSLAGSHAGREIFQRYGL